MNQFPDIRHASFGDRVVTSEDGVSRFLKGRKRMTARWQSSVASAMERERLSIKEIVRRTGKAENTVRKWLRDIPAKRDSVICFGYVLGETEAGVNALLDMALFPRLYVKNPDDAIWLYLLQKRPRDYPRDIAKTHESYRERFICLLQGKKEEDATDSVDTHAMSKRLQEATSDQAFSEFIRTHETEFRHRYQKLTACIFDWVQISPEDKIRRELFRIGREGYAKNRVRLDVPKRDHIIALGIYLGMPIVKINEMLNICGLTLLGEADLIVEAAILYILDDLEKTDPDVLSISELNLSEKLAGEEYSYRVQRVRAKYDWEHHFGIAPLREVKEAYYEQVGEGREQFLPYSVAEYVASRMAESSIREINRANLLTFL